MASKIAGHHPLRIFSVIRMSISTRESGENWTCGDSPSQKVPKLKKKKLSAPFVPQRAVISQVFPTSGMKRCHPPKVLGEKLWRGLDLEWLQNDEKNKTSAKIDQTWPLVMFCKIKTNPGAAKHGHQICLRTEGNTIHDQTRPSDTWINKHWSHD